MSATEKCANCGHGRDSHMKDDRCWKFYDHGPDDGFVQCECRAFRSIPKFARVDYWEPLGMDMGRQFPMVRVYVHGEHQTNVLFRSRALAKIFAVLLDLSVMHRSDPSAR